MRFTFSMLVALVVAHEVVSSDPSHLFSLRPISKAQQTLDQTTESSTHNPLVEEPQCSCDAQAVWEDIMLLFDSSEYAAISHRDFIERTSTVISDLAYLNIETTGSATQHHTRIGVISYGDVAILSAPLGSLNRVAFERQDVVFTRDANTNISDALRLATDQLNSWSHRQNVRPVIILVANTMTDGETSPVDQANDFKEKGGIIVVYSFDPVGEQKNLDVLKQLASPGYFLHDVNDDFHFSNLPPLVKAMCNANCFCPTGYSSPILDPSRRYPIAGCYTSSRLIANEVLAHNNCQLRNGGFVSSAIYKEKSQHLENLVGVGNKFWIGLTYNKMTDSYFWSDGTPLNGTWHPWAGERALTSDACVFEVKMKWYPVQCRASYDYVCEATPCSSMMYCDKDY